MIRGELWVFPSKKLFFQNLSHFWYCSSLRVDLIQVNYLVLGHLYLSWHNKLRLGYSIHSIVLNILWLVWLHRLDLSHLNRLRHWLSLLIHMLVTLLVDGLVISFAWKRYFNLHVTFSLLRNCSFNPRIRSVNLYRSLLPFLISHLLCYELLLRYLISLLSTIKG